MSLFGELKRRNVFRAVAAYVVMGWLLIEVGATLEETLRLPEWADTLLAFFLILGFPIVLFFSWAYEITPDGVRRESEISQNIEARAATGRRLDRVIMVLMAVALTYFAVDRFVLVAPPVPDSETMGLQVNRADRPTVDEAPTPDGTMQAQPLNADLSIAVLPFMNMSSDPEQEYFADGLTEELLNLLARIDELKVAARTSSFYYKDRMHDIPFREIGRQLEVAHLLEGSVRKGGDRIRITAQLIKAEDGFHLWSETWDRTLDDVFAIQDEIAAAVTEKLRIELLGEAPHARIVDPRSWELTQQARFFFNRRGPGDLERAFERYREAIEIDPDNADALAEISPLYRWNFDPPDVESSLRSAQRALELDPDNAVAHARIAPVMYRQGDVEQAKHHMLRALDLGRKSPTALSIWSGWSSSFGEYDLEIRFYEKALSIDPLHRVNLGNLSNCYLWAGRFEEAENTLSRINELGTTHRVTQVTQAELRLLSGQPTEAVHLLEQIPSRDDRYVTNMTPYTRDLLMLVARHRANLLDDPAGALEQFVEQHGDRPFAVAQAQAELGFTQLAFDTLSAVYGESGPVTGGHLNAPYFENLRDDPRWDALVARVNVMPSEMRALADEVLSE